MADLPALFTKLAPVPRVTPAVPVIVPPEASVRLPLVACMTTAPAPLIGEFTLMPLKADNVRVAAALVQVMGALTLMSPAPADCVPAPEADVAGVCSVPLVPAFKLLSMVVEAVESMVRGGGSMRQA